MAGETHMLRASSPIVSVCGMQMLWRNSHMMLRCGMQSSGAQQPRDVKSVGHSDVLVTNVSVM
jgi:hypothetical protein